MDHGLEFRTESGRLQIGERSCALYMAQKGTTYAWSNARDIAVTPTVPYDAIAIAPADALSIKPEPSFGGTKAANTTTQIHKNPVEADPNYLIAYDWYAFRRYSHLAPSTSGSGLELQHPVSGEVMFSTRQPKILKGFPAAVTAANKDGFEVPVLAGRTYAFLAYGMCRVKATSAVGGYWNHYYTGVYVHPVTGRIMAGCTTYLTSSFDAGPTSFDGGIFACDVTNY
jgi:hypothetical protein